MRNNTAIDFQTSKQIDILRGLAVSAVVIVHTNQIGSQILNKNLAHEAASWFSKLMNFGIYGVQLFFAISGFLIFSLYGKNFQPRNYFLRRFSRIYPLWFIFLALGIIQSPLLENSVWHTGTVLADQRIGDISFPFLTLILALTLTLFLKENLWNGVIPGGWSIQAEVIHYLAFPFIQKYTNRKKVISLSVLIIIFQMAYFALAMYASEESYLRKLFMRLNLGSTFFFFSLGLLVLMIKNKEFKLRESHSKKDLMILTIASVAAGLVLISDANFGNNFHAALFLLTMFVVSKSILNDSWISRSFNNIGKYSYFIYFAHFQVLWALNSISKHSNFFSFLRLLDNDNLANIFLLVIAIFTIGLCNLVGRFSMNFIERPIQGYFLKFER